MYRWKGNAQWNIIGLKRRSLQMSKLLIATQMHPIGYTLMVLRGADLGDNGR